MSKNEITVLLVEDELTLAMIIKDTLEDSGFIIHTAADGGRAASFLRTPAGCIGGRCYDAQNGWFRNGA